MELIPLGNISDNEEFWRGTRFRIVGVGLNVKNKNDDYYEYMLTEISGNDEYMQLTNVVGNKSGSILALVKIKPDKKRLVVTGQALKFSMGLDNTYLIKED